MSRREGRDSQSKRLHSRSEREPSPKKPRRDGKPATERTCSSNHNMEITDTTVRDQKQRRRLQDALPLEAPPAPESKVQPDIVNKGLDRKSVGLLEVNKNSSEPAEVPRSRSYFQHDERSSAGHGGRSFARKATDRERWSDPKEQSSDRVRDKVEAHDVQKKSERTQSREDHKNVWRHDGFFDLESGAPPSRKRPAFRETKISTEPESAAGAQESESIKVPRHDRPALDTVRREERGDYYYSHGPDKPGRSFTRPDERNVKRGDGSLHRAEMQRSSYLSRERFGSGGGTRGRDRFNGRFGERNTSRPGGGFQVEKWKHDLYDEANRSPTPKNEEEQIAKVEALLAL